jgi:hypothetical protein
MRVATIMIILSRSLFEYFHGSCRRILVSQTYPTWEGPAGYIPATTFSETDYVYSAPHLQCLSSLPWHPVAQPLWAIIGEYPPNHKHYSGINCLCGCGGRATFACVRARNKAPNNRGRTEAKGMEKLEGVRDSPRTGCHGGSPLLETLSGTRLTSRASRATFNNMTVRCQPLVLRAFVGRKGSEAAMSWLQGCRKRLWKGSGVSRSVAKVITRRCLVQLGMNVGSGRWVRHWGNTALLIGSMCGSSSGQVTQE